MILSNLSFISPIWQKEESYEDIKQSHIWKQVCIMCLISTPVVMCDMSHDHIQ